MAATLESVQQAMGEEYFHDLGNASGLVEICCDVIAGRFQVAQYWYPLANRFEIIERERDFCSASNGEEM